MVGQGSKLAERLIASLGLGLPSAIGAQVRISGAHTRPDPKD